ncbi:MAG TPA: AAA family ATPase [Acidimicrobiia bacterium]|nr:AAA family ATPase [Acidimicrobiia bacterium]
MRRVSVVGNSGSGKSTLAKALAGRLGVPYIELDAVFHQPGWVPLPRDEFRARVAALAAGSSWVIDGNYSAVRDLVWAKADTVVWIDLPRPLVMRRVIGRTIRRAVRREELWNGNREPSSNWLTLDPERSIIMWSWTQHAKYRLRYAEAIADPALAHLTFVRLRSPADVRAFLSG